MSKFKVLEKSRFLSNEDMGNIKGSACINTYTNCTGGGGYEVCMPSVTTFSTSSCGNGGTHMVCGIDRIYASCTPAGLAYYLQVCGSGGKYETLSY